MYNKIKKEKGAATGVIIAIVAVLIMVVGIFYYNLIPRGDDNLMMKDDDSMTEGEKMIEENGAMNDDSTMIEGEDSMMTGSYMGQVLAGSSAPLLDFKEEDYEKAILSDKLVVLYFYANWCPICRAEFPKMQAAFNELQSSEVIGFRVNYNDNQTDDYEENLAREFGVAYQHTKVFIKNGERVLKSPESWEQSRYISEINNNL
ncbi:MAG: hypothetical protein COV70_03830 [Parcubacteria group bacterium CG11_big_fil_rev_8_21_14_0_20_39_22]|nr:MAG: hypothetical protein COV70_03830 [Parcubacteria group bacterium CG11_big_fil_rev_8_21_14_0_20_39_22]